MREALQERESADSTERCDCVSGLVVDGCGFADGGSRIEGAFGSEGEPMWGEDGGWAPHEPAPRAAAKRKRKRKSEALDVGREGEFVAACFLTRRGYDIIHRNWKCKAGEADIIARDNETLVFVEVKSRRDCDKGMPAEAVTREKRERYERIAASYLAVTDVLDVRVRFDIVSILIIPPDRALVRHNIDAFGRDVF